MQRTNAEKEWWNHKLEMLHHSFAHLNDCVIIQTIFQTASITQSNFNLCNGSNAPL